MKFFSASIGLSLIITLTLQTSCRVKRHVPETEKLYDGGEVVLKSNSKITGKRDLQNELNDLLRPKPNKKILGARFYLWTHFKGSKEGAGKFYQKLNKKYGEKPVYLSAVDTNKTIKLIQNRLENRGYFFSAVKVNINLHRKTSTVNYTVRVSDPYQLQNYVYVPDSSDISKNIKKSLNRTILKKGIRYDLDQLKKERERIDNYLKNRGYYNFRPDNLVFKVDTNQSQTRLFDLYLNIKEGSPKEGLVPYKINSVTVFADYSVQEGKSRNKADTSVYDSITFIQGEKYFKPWHLKRYVMIKPGKLYSLRSQNNTSSRLSTIGTFRYVNIRYRQPDSLYVDSAGYGYLDTDIFLSTFNSQAVRFELQALSKSNNFVGPEFLASYRNRSIFNAGELLAITGKVGYETQFISGQNTGLYSYMVGIQTDLVFPRMLTPITIKRANTYSVPKTKISVSYDILNRIQYYKLTSALASFGYTWNSSRYITHEINPVSVNYVQITNITDAFKQILAENPYLAISFQQQFIAGLTYSFVYNQLAQKTRRNSILFMANTDFSGNAINGIQSAAGNKDSVKTLLGQPYAQYAKVDGDIRLYKKLNKGSQLVLRFFAGIGLPYGNSTQLPFIKQYFSGGPSSIRAFRARSIGPGSYFSNKSYSESYWDQSGNVKLEANIEYRFPIISVLKGAWFVDAGNVWLSSDNASLPGGAFGPNWYTEIAVGAGFGARIDIDYFVIRFDLATPLRNPGLPQSERWTGLLNLGNGWNSRNLVLNFAIGYPF